MKSSMFICLYLCLFSAKAETLLNEPSNTHCGNIFVDKQFVLTSENYPRPYPPGKECFYLLKGGNCTTHFNIEFLDFNLISSVGCVKDRLEIGIQDALCGIRNGSKVYISEKGSLKLKFVSDDDTEKNGRGFKLRVTRMGDCEPINTTVEEDFTVENRDSAEDATETVQFEWTTKPNRSYLPPKSQPCCQNNIFSSKKLTLVSPNFPFSINAPTDCSFVIRKASPRVCRLRISVLFFTLGLPDENSCPNGRLEIDGKYICGCNSDLQLISNFGGSESKTLKFHSPGYNTGDVSGFVLEIIQDECQKTYSPEDNNVAEKATGKFRYYKDQFNRIKWPQNSNINQLRLVKERSYYLPSEASEMGGQFGDVFKHFYFFAPEDEKDMSWTQTGREREETDYMDVSAIEALVTNRINHQQCRTWNANQFIMLEARFGLNGLRQLCQSSQQTVGSEDDCFVLRSFRGSFTSPGYPLGYPATRNFCYRFKLLPGFCSVRIHFNDFQVEQSYDCLKDYLAINQYRYCGNYLANKRVTIFTEGESHQDLKFVSDVNYCEKGFSAVYQQVRCQTPGDNSITPVSCNPGGKTADDENPISCGRVISDKYFSISNGYSASSCVYDITKYSENVCKVQFHFESFFLPCEAGSIAVNGRIFCGDRSGESLRLDFIDALRVVYRQNGQHNLAPKAGFSIRGEQIDCDTVTPEPVRLVSGLPPTLNGSSPTSHEVS